MPPVTTQPHRFTTGDAAGAPPQDTPRPSFFAHHTIADVTTAQQPSPLRQAMRAGDPATGEVSLAPFRDEPARLIAAEMGAPNPVELRHIARALRANVDPSAGWHTAHLSAHRLELLADRLEQEAAAPQVVLATTAPDSPEDAVLTLTPREALALYLQLHALRLNGAL